MMEEERTGAADAAQKLSVQHGARKARRCLGRSGVRAGGQPQGLSLLVKPGT